MKAAAAAEKERRRNERAWRGDFTVFCSKLQIKPKSGVRENLRPNPIQAAFQAARTARDLVLKPRQVGLTTWELARDVWYFLTKPGALVVVVCQSMADDVAIKENSEKLRIMFESLQAQGLARNVVQRSMTEWALPGSDAVLRIVGAGASEAAAEKKGRSGTINRLHVTELAFFEYARSTMNAILECVPAPEFGSEITIESTANGATGLFYEMYQAAKSSRSSYKAHFFSWLEMPEYRAELAANDNLVSETPREKELVERRGASLEQLKWYRAKVADKGQDLVDQEYPVDEETCWLTSGRLFFDRERTKALLAAATAPIETVEVGREGSHGVLRVWKHAQPGRKYVVVIDPSEGVGGDPGVALVLDRGSGEHVATLSGQFTTWEMARLAAEVAKERYARALIAVERNNHGHAVLQGLVREQKYFNLYVGADKRPGWVTGEISRAAALEALHNAHREKHWSSPDRNSLAEMLTFVVLANGRPEAAPGSNDDHVLAHAIGWDVVCRPSVERFVPVGFVA